MVGCCAALLAARFADAICVCSWPPLRPLRIVVYTYAHDGAVQGAYSCFYALHRPFASRIYASRGRCGRACRRCLRQIDARPILHLRMRFVCARFGRWTACDRTTCASPPRPSSTTWRYDAACAWSIHTLVPAAASSGTHILVCITQHTLRSV